VVLLLSKTSWRRKKRLKLNLGEARLALAMGNGLDSRKRRAGEKTPRQECAN
jgi:hypothetical protein